MGNGIQHRTWIVRLYLGVLCLSGLTSCEAVRSIPSPLTLVQKDCSDSLPCPDHEVCVLKAPQSFRCVPRHAGPTPWIRFPFKPADSVVCVQGPQVAASESKPHSSLSHLSQETLFAADFSLKGPGERAAVHAGIDGTALVFEGCGPQAPLECGNGLGNHVRILNRDGPMVLYAHMGRIEVQNGQSVRAGDVLGQLGASGDVHRPLLHLSAHFTPEARRSWVETLSYYRERPGAVPPSIPFETEFCDPAVTSGCRPKRVRAEQIPCQASSGRPPLRSDSRTW